MHSYLHKNFILAKKKWVLHEFNNYYVLLNIAFVSYYYYLYELNILGTCIKASVSLSQTRVWHRARVSQSGLRTGGGVMTGGARGTIAEVVSESS
jgi:hypothetical protein